MDLRGPWNDQCCEDCKAECNDIFKKVLELKNSGLVIYVHKGKDKKNAATGENCDAVILFNTTDKIIKRPTFMSEFGQQKVKCFQCRTLIQKVRNLLTEIKCIKGNETIGVCDYCKQSNVSNCKRCEYMVSKFMSKKNNAEEMMLQYYKTWVSKVMIFLQSLLDGSICEHNFHQGDAEELRTLLNELKSPLSIRQPDIEMFPFLEELTYFDNLIESKELLDKLLLKFKKINELYPDTPTPTNILPAIGTNSKEENIHYDPSDDEYSFAKNQDLIKFAQKFKKDKADTTSDILDTYIKTGKSAKIDNLGKSEIKEKLPKHDEKFEVVFEKKMTKRHDNVNITNPDTEKQKNIKRKGNMNDKKIKKKKENNEDLNIINKKQKIKDKKGEKLDKKGEKLDKKGEKLDKSKKKKDDLNDGMKMKWQFLENNKNRKEKRGDKPLPVTKVQSLPDLPALHFRESQTSSGSYIECADTRVVPKVMIKGQNIVPLHRIENETVDAVVPLLYHIEKNISNYSCKIPNPTFTRSIATSTSLPTISDKSEKNTSKSVVTGAKGVLSFQLSNPDCITKGWTSLPSLKIKRRMNVYKMNPVNPRNSWFERNKNNIIMYESEERFADIDKEGFGKLFYKNGFVALEYLRAKEPYAGYRYIIYSDGELENGMSRPVTVLGVFDGIGNGVIYDNFGCERLKYNQTEGMLIDQSIDSPCKWKWHTLNEPPVLQPVFINTYCKKPNKLFEKESGSATLEMKNAKVTNDGMLKIELENFLKEKAHKLLQKFKPLEIKTKVLKINRQFSLRIFQQSDIYLMFREGRKSVKINLGLILVSNEIVNTETVDVSQVCTSYDRFPPRSESIENIQRILGSVRNVKKRHTR